MSKVGFRIFSGIERADKELIERFRDIPVSNINDMMNRLYNTDGSIKAMNDVPLLGPAFTVRVPQGDNMMVHRALDLAQPGDILVIDDGGCTLRSLIGEMMYTYAIMKGLGGIVVNGSIRDVDAARRLPIPIYAKAVTPQGPYKNGPGEINVPVCCGGVVVMPGDIVAGDPDGLVIIRKEDAPLIYEEARKKMEGEKATLAGYKEHGLAGVTHENQWIKAVEAAGVLYVDA